LSARASRECETQIITSRTSVEDGPTNKSQFGLIAAVRAYGSARVRTLSVVESTPLVDGLRVCPMVAAIASSSLCIGSCDHQAASGCRHCQEVIRHEPPSLLAQRTGPCRRCISCRGPYMGEATRGESGHAAMPARAASFAAIGQFGYRSAQGVKALGDKIDVRCPGSRLRIERVTFDALHTWPISRCARRPVEARVGGRNYSG
jgi:hypothetical protein